MVCGHKFDGVDTDPRNGGDESRAALEAEGAMPRVYGRATTPSGGTHELVATMGIHSHDKVRPGLDVKAGAVDGEGRGFLFIAPTRKRSKVDGTIGECRWDTPPDLAALAAHGPEDRSGEPLAELIDAPRKSRTARPHNSRVPQAASDAEVAAFVAEYQRAERPEILQGWVKALTKHFRGKRSRHDGAVSVLTGALKEARAGYFSAKAALDTLRPMFLAAATRPPTGGECQRSAGQALDEWNDIVAWAVREARVADLDEVHRRVAEKMPGTPVAGAARVLVQRTDEQRAARLRTRTSCFGVGSVTPMTSMPWTRSWLPQRFRTSTAICFGCSWCPGQVTPRPSLCRRCKVLVHMSCPRSPQKRRCCRQHRGRSVAPTPAAVYCVRSVNRAYWSSRTSRRSCRWAVRCAPQCWRRCVRYMTVAGSALSGPTVAARWSGKAVLP